MRLCDYCALEIQDEAVYCRYCHRQLKPYAGLRGKIRCPYCAEWIERNATECEHCERALTPPEPEPEPLPIAPAAPPRRTWDPRDVLLEESPAPADETPGPPRHRSRLFGLGAKPQPAAPALEDSAFTPDSEAEASSKRGGLLGLGRPRKEPTALEPRPPELSVPAALWGSSYIEETPLTPPPDLASRRRGKPPPPPTMLPAESGGRRSWSTILLVLLLVVVAAGVLVVLLRSGLPSLPSLVPAVPRPTATRPLPTAASLPTFPPATPTPGATPGQPVIANCLRWEEVTLSNAGQTLCVYGELKRWFAADEIPFVALFSEARGSFAIVDRAGIHYEAQPGSCITATGEVEVMAGTRPFIDAAGELLTCP